MAGAKETPRQKMIGMMYLVLTAMLALNVSVEVLDAFHIVNEGIENVNTSVGKKIDDYYLTFEQQYDKQPEKAEPYWNAAQEIRTKTDEIISFIEKEIKLQLLLRNQDVTEEQLLNPEEGEAPVILNADEVKNASDRRTYYKVNLAAELNQRDKYDIPTAFMMNDKNAERLREKVDEYRQFVIDAVESTGINNYDSQVGLRTDQKYYKDGSELTWEQHNFDLVILPAVISILNELVGEIQTTEYNAIAELFKNIGASDYKFNTLTAKVFPKSTYVLSGQDYEADVFIVASDDTREFDAKYIRGAKHFNANSNAIQTASSKSGVLKLKFPTKQEGEQFYSGVIEMINPETGEVEPYPFESSYTVAPPSASAAPTKMNIIYRGLDNPIQISAPGFTNDQLLVDISSGNIEKSNNQGLYVVNVMDTVAESVTITTSTMIDGKKVKLGTTDFRLKSVPSPTAMIAGKVNGNIKSREMLNAGSVTPVLPDFDFEGYNFTIQSYTFSCSVGGSTLEIGVDGADFSPEVREIISKIASQQKVYFENIKAKGPDGKIVDLNSIILVVRR